MTFIIINAIDGLLSFDICIQKNKTQNRIFVEMKNILVSGRDKYFFYAKDFP